MKAVYQTMRQVASSRASVLLLGETGTGKALIAKALHELSDRRHGPFVSVNCGALSENQLESALFGHSQDSRPENPTGQFEAAHAGTLFLDEITSVPERLQVRLLRELQEQKLGTRVIAASNRDLLEEVAEGRFREDLYYRLNVVPIYLPPLRERREDVHQLATQFLSLYSQQNNRSVTRIAPEAIEALESYSWPGNVGELQNYIERAVVMAQGDELMHDLLPGIVRGESATPTTTFRRFDFESLAEQLVHEGLSTADEEAEDLHSRVVDRVEREVIAQVLAQCEGVQTKAAQRLGINRNTLHKKIKEYGLDGAPAANGKSA